MTSLKNAIKREMNWKVKQRCTKVSIFNYFL